MDEINSRVISDAASSFPSFIALRAKHSDLLQREPDTEDAKAKCLKEVEHFIRQGQATGAILSDPEERRSSQNILNYWVSTLYRQDQIARLATLADYNPTLTVQLDDVSCPYPGVHAFTEQNSQFFFGRQRQIDYMLGRLKEDRLLVIVGPSGSGKTSLVQAGLLPALKKEQANSVKRFFFLPIVPGSEPLKSLALMIKRAQDLTGDDPRWLQEQVARFKRDKTHLLNLIEETTDDPAVIFIDQGEELYERSVSMLLRPFENILDFDNSKETVEPFLDNLVRVVQSPGRNHIVIIARRTGDYEPYTKRLPSRVREVFEPARVILPALYASELRDAIEKPAELLGVKFENPVSPGPEVTGSGLEMKSTETTVQALVKEISSEPVGLPLLQFALPRLWEKRDDNKIPDHAFLEMVSCRAALSATAEKFSSSLPYFDQRTCRRVLTQLVKLDRELKPHVYPVRRTTLYRSTEKHARVDSLIESLTEKQLVRVSKGEIPADDWVELTHASLLSNWPRMRAWVDKKRRRSRQLKAAKVVGLAALIAVFILAGLFIVGWQQQRTKSRDLARLSSKQLANNRLDLALLVGFAAYQTEVNTATRSNLHKLLYSLQFPAQPKRFLRKENFEAIDLSFTTEQDRPPSRLAVINLAGDIVFWDLNWGNPPAIEHTVIADSKATSPLIFSPDGRILATASTDPNVKVILWDLTRCEPRDCKYTDLSVSGTTETQASFANTEDAGGTLGLVFKPDGQTLFSADADGSVIRWDIGNPNSVKSTTVFKHRTQISSIAVNAQGELAVGGADGAVLLLDVSGTRAKSRVIAKGYTTGTVGDVAIYNVAFSSNGQLLAASRIDRAMIWQVKSGELRRELSIEPPPRPMIVSFNDQGDSLLGYNVDGNVFSWDVQRGGGSVLYKVERASQSVSFSANGKFLALPNEDGAVIWDIPRQRALVGSYPINAFAFRPDSNILTVGDAGGITSWQTQNPDEHSKLTKPIEEGEVLNLAYSADGTILAAGLNNGVISLRDAESLEPIRVLTRTFEVRDGETVPAATISNIVFDPRKDGHRLVEALNINTQIPAKASSEIILWNADTGEQTPLAESQGSVIALAFSPNGTLAWSITDAENNFVSGWNSVDQKQIGAPIKTKEQVTSLAFSPDGKVLAVGLDNGKIELWDETFKKTALIEGVSGVVVDLEFSPDGSILACATNLRSELKRKLRPGTITLWDMWEMKGEQPEQLGDLLRGHRDAITSLAFSPDGKILVSVGVSVNIEEEVHLWDVNVAGARSRFCELIDCRRTYEEVAPHLDKETPVQWLYRKTIGKASLRELNP